MKRWIRNIINQISSELNQFGEKHGWNWSPYFAIADLKFGKSTMRQTIQMLNLFSSNCLYRFWFFGNKQTRVFIVPLFCQYYRYTGHIFVSIQLLACISEHTFTRTNIDNILIRWQKIQNKLDEVSNDLLRLFCLRYIDKLISINDSKEKSKSMSLQSSEHHYDGGHARQNSWNIT